MSTNQYIIQILIKKGTDGFRGRRIMFGVYFQDMDSALQLNYIRLTDIEVRTMAIRMIRMLRKCSEPEAFLRYFIRRRTISYETGQYHLRDVPVKSSARAIERIFLDFVKESPHIPHLTLENKKTNLNELDKEFAKMAIVRGMPIRLTSFDSLPMSILRLQIENYFKGGPFAHVRYKWINKGNATFDLKELLSGFPIHYSPPIFENNCNQQHSISFRRKDGDPIFRLKIDLCTGKHEQRCNTPVISLYTDIVGEREDVSYDDFRNCCFELLFI